MQGVWVTGEMHLTQPRVHASDRDQSTGIQGRACDRTETNKNESGTERSPRHLYRVPLPRDVARAGATRHHLFSHSSPDNAIES